MNRPKAICPKCGKAGVNQICVVGRHWIFTCLECNFKNHCKCNDKYKCFTIPFEGEKK